jgi:hypothetical protein
MRDLKIDDLTTGLRTLADTDSAATTEYDPNLKHIMVDDPLTGRRPAKTIAEVFTYSGDHRNLMVDSLTTGRVPITIGAVAAWSPSALFAALR